MRRLAAELEAVVNELLTTGAAHRSLKALTTTICCSIRWLVS